MEVIQFYSGQRVIDKETNKKGTVVVHEIREKRVMILVDGEEEYIWADEDKVKGLKRKGGYSFNIGNRVVIFGKKGRVVAHDSVTKTVIIITDDGQVAFQNETQVKKLRKITSRNKNEI